MACERLSSPLRMAQVWLAAKKGRNSHVSFCNSGLVALTRQS